MRAIYFHFRPPFINRASVICLYFIPSSAHSKAGEKAPACILPHGVLFRGNAEADIREALIRKGLIKGIFMIDAGEGFIKDGNKNCLREMDIHKIVDVFNKQTEIDGYSKIVSFAEIEKNEFNLNIPRYIDSSESEDLQDIEALLATYTGKALIDRYDVFQHLMNYWSETMQDDCYLIATDGWKAETHRIIETNKKGKQIDKGWTCDLIPKTLVTNRYFAEQKILKTYIKLLTQEAADLEKAVSGHLRKMGFTV